MQTLQAHVPGALVGALTPAAAQLKPPNVDFGSSGPAAVAGAESGRGSSQEAHFVLAESLSTMQTLHVHVPGAFVGALTPAAAQLKPPMGAVGLGGSDIVPLDADSGRGSSHETHLALATSLLSMHRPHVHEPIAFIGGFIPAASQLKPVEAGFAPKMNANVGREDESATKATLRSFA